MNPLDVFRKKFETYRKVCDESGSQAALEALFEGYPERQKQNMGTFIDKYNTLAEAFSAAVEPYKQIGMEMLVHDVSNNNFDAVLEIQRTCPMIANNIHTEFGVERPCDVVCELDVKATNTAFPDIKGHVLCRQADGFSVCMFTYQRPKK